MSKQTIDQATIEAQIEALKAELKEVKKANRKPRSLSVKVSKSGGVSVYGLQRFPVSLYKSQWDRLINEGLPLVQKCIEENLNKLVDKENV